MSTKAALFLCLVLATAVCVGGPVPEGYVLFAERGIVIGSRCSIDSGDIGANGTAADSVVFEWGATTAGTCTVRANRVKLGARATVGDVVCNVLEEDDSAVVLGVTTPK